MFSWNLFKILRCFEVRNISGGNLLSSRRIFISELNAVSQKYLSLPQVFSVLTVVGFP